jgi:hypothetical protein
MQKKTIWVRAVKKDEALPYSAFAVISKRSGGVLKNLFQNHRKIMVSQRI